MRCNTFWEGAWRWVGVYTFECCAAIRMTWSRTNLGSEMSKKGSFWHFSRKFPLPDPPSRGGSSGTLIIRRDGLPSWQRGAIGERSPCFTATFWPPPTPPFWTPKIPLFYPFLPIILTPFLTFLPKNPPFALQGSKFASPPQRGEGGSFDCPSF